MGALLPRRLGGFAPLLLALAVSGAACQPPAPTAAPAPPEQHTPGEPFPEHTYFRDVTAGSGIDFTYRNGEEADHYAILESLGGGVALLDYDGDGLLDVFLTGGGYYAGPESKEIRGHPGKLYRNLGGFRFGDVTEQAGLAAPLFYTHGAAAADYDNDGWTDLLVTGWGRVALFRNVAGEGGARRFEEVTERAGLPHRGPFWGTSAAWADLDGDGWADLYICQYVNWSWDNNPHCGGYTPTAPRDVCPPKQFDGLPDALYRNNGDGTFTDVSRGAGLRVPPREDGDYGKGLGVLAADLNGDLKPEVYVGNDTSDNFLYLNRGGPGDLRFEEAGFNLGVARDGNGVPNGSMGIDAADYDGSGRLSLWVTNYENEFHALYRNRTEDPARPRFHFATPAAGLGVIGPIYVGFGTGFTDVQNDGWPDLVILNGHVVRHPARDNLAQPPILFLNEAAGERRRFVHSPRRAGPAFAEKYRGRGLAVGDLDNDGWPDLVFSNVRQPAKVLRNTASDAHPGHHWLGVELAGKDCRDLVGTRLTLEVGGRKLTRAVKGGGSYLSTNDRRILFGLGPENKVGKLTVEWSTGEPRREEWEGLEVDRYHRLAQGGG